MDGAGQRLSLRFVGWHAQCGLGRGLIIARGRLPYSVIGNPALAPHGDKRVCYSSVLGHDLGRQIDGPLEGAGLAYHLQLLAQVREPGGTQVSAV
jgi:hypothetical protein